MTFPIKSTKASRKALRNDAARRGPKRTDADLELSEDDNTPGT